MTSLPVAISPLRLDIIEDPPTVIVFDMDGTLIAFRDGKGDEMGFVIRPHAVDVILDLWMIPNVFVVLWSAGTSPYVHNIVDVVLLPALQAKNPMFYFSTVMTYDDTDCGIKDLHKIKKLYNTPNENIILIDDTIAQCGVNMVNGFRAILVTPYDPSYVDIDGMEDDTLLKVREKIRI